MPPHLQVSLEGRHQQILGLLKLCQSSAPLEEAFTLQLVELFAGSCGIPFRPPGYRKTVLVLLLLSKHGLLLLGGEEVRVALIGMDNLDVVHLLGGEVGSGQLGSGQELVESALLGDGAHLDPGSILLVVGDVFLAGRMVDTSNC